MIPKPKPKSVVWDSNLENKANKNLALLGNFYKQYDKILFTQLTNQQIEILDNFLIKELLIRKIITIKQAIHFPYENYKKLVNNYKNTRFNLNSRAQTINNSSKIFVGHLSTNNKKVNESQKVTNNDNLTSLKYFLNMGYANYTFQAGENNKITSQNYSTNINNEKLNSDEKNNNPDKIENIEGKKQIGFFKPMQNDQTDPNSPSEENSIQNKNTI